MVHAFGGAAIAFQPFRDVARPAAVEVLLFRAAMDISPLLAETRGQANALDLLVPVYDWSTEGFDTAALKRRRMLLDALA